SCPLPLRRYLWAHCEFGGPPDCTGRPRDGVGGPAHRKRSGRRRTVYSYSTTAAIGTWIWSDRKSTRLNSSHVSISYAVFCLKKKKSEIDYIPYFHDN